MDVFPTSPCPRFSDPLTATPAGIGTARHSSGDRNLLLRDGGPRSKWPSQCGKQKSATGCWTRPLRVSFPITTLRACCTSTISRLLFLGGCLLPGPHRRRRGQPRCVCGCGHPGSPVHGQRFLSNLCDAHTLDILLQQATHGDKVSLLNITRAREREPGKWADPPPSSSIGMPTSSERLRNTASAQDTQ